MDQSKKSRRPSNAQIIDALTRLFELLKNDKAVNENPAHLSHWRELPSDVSTAYGLLQEGAQLVHGTATKYTLVGKIDEEEQKKLGADLLSGCEVIGAATHILLQDAAGCSRAVRRSAQRAALAIIVNVKLLAVSFFDKSALDENIGAQKTGAVWEACDKVLNKMVPLGNRNAIRRELFTWTRETNDSMDEFQEMVDTGPATKTTGAIEEAEDNFFGDDEQYSEDDLPIAVACLGILKCSRGTMKLSLETCEDLGKKFAKNHKEGYLDSIQVLHAMAKEVGEGVTDFGSLLYPPLLPDTAELLAKAQEQTDAILKLIDFVMGLDELPPDVSELANVLRVGAETRKRELLKSIEP